MMIIKFKPFIHTQLALVGMKDPEKKPPFRAPADLVAKIEMAEMLAEMRDSKQEQQGKHKFITGLDLKTVEVDAKGHVLKNHNHVGEDHFVSHSISHPNEVQSTTSLLDHTHTAKRPDTLVSRAAEDHKHHVHNLEGQVLTHVTDTQNKTGSHTLNPHAHHIKGHDPNTRAGNTSLHAHDVLHPHELREMDKLVALPEKEKPNPTTNHHHHHHHHTTHHG